MITFIVHFIDIHIHDLVTDPISSASLMVVSCLYAILGGVLQLRNNKKKLVMYVLGIFIIVSIAMVALLFNNTIIVVVALLGFLLGFFDFRLAIKKLS